jgi:hypothetical protein
MDVAIRGEMTVSDGTTRDTWRTALLVAAPAWLAARVLVGAAHLLARIATDRGWVDDPLARVTVRQGLLAWDGAFYADVAGAGYAALPRAALRFFPAQALAGRSIGWLGPGPRLGVVIVANLAALAAGVLLVVLVRREGLAAGVARRAAWLLALAPSAFVLVLGYAEALFLTAVLGAFLAVRTRRFAPAAALGLVAGLTRPSGFVLAVPVAVELVRSWRDLGGRGRASGVAAVAAPFLGTLAYLAWVGDRFGDALAPFRIQTRAHLKGSFTDPLSSTVDAVRGMFDGHLGTGLHVPWMILVVVLVVVSFRRLPVSYGMYAACTVASALTSSNLDSFERYALVAFPVVIVVALLLDEHPRWWWPAITTSAVAMTGYATLAMTHAYVP